MTISARRGAAAIDKTLTLFLALVDDDGAAPLAQIAKNLDVPTSTAQRMVSALLRAGVIGRVGRGRYGAGPRLANLHVADSARAALVHAARRPVRELARVLYATAHLGVLEGDMVTYLVKEAGGGGAVPTGELIQLEAYCSGLGKVLLAHQSDDALEIYLRAAPFIALTPNTITDPDVLRAELRRVRSEGRAFDDAEVQDGLYCIAVPVLGPGGKVVAALSASRSHLTWRDSRELQLVRRGAARISQRLGASVVDEEEGSAQPQPVTPGLRTSASDGPQQASPRSRGSIESGAIP